MKKKHICIISACYNEKDNITELYQRITSVMATVPQYTYEIRIIDNHSTDGTREEIEALCSHDKNFKAIYNVRNFGPLRSAYYNLYSAEGDATIALAADLEDPPELITSFLEEWEKGAKIVMAVRNGTEEKGLFPFLRTTYYNMLKYISDVKLVSYFTGFGLYDQEVIKTLKTIDDPYPYLRGLLCELGWPAATVSFFKPRRKRGVSSYNFMRYFEEAMQGIVSQSRLPLHFATLFGCIISGVSFIVGLYYLTMKLLNWDGFQTGIAPAIVGLFFMMGLLFLILGLLGEYISLLVTHIVRRPMVIEERRINFEPDDRRKESDDGDS